MCLAISSDPDPMLNPLFLHPGRRPRKPSVQFPPGPPLRLDPRSRIILPTYACPIRPRRPDPVPAPASNSRQAIHHIRVLAALHPGRRTADLPRAPRKSVDRPVRRAPNLAGTLVRQGRHAQFPAGRQTVARHAVCDRDPETRILPTHAPRRVRRSTALIPCFDVRVAG